MTMLITILQLLCGLAIIVMTMFQSGKNAGLSGAIAGGSDSYMSKNKNSSLDQVLANSTKWIALVWVILTLSLSLV